MIHFTTAVLDRTVIITIAVVVGGTTLLVLILLIACCCCCYCCRKRKGWETKITKVLLVPKHLLCNKFSMITQNTDHTCNWSHHVCMISHLLLITTVVLENTEVRKPKYGNRSMKVKKKSHLSVLSVLLTNDCVCWGLVANGWLSPSDLGAESWDLSCSERCATMVTIC